jgi:hypothetical protein
VTIDGQGTTRCFELIPPNGKSTTPAVLEDLSIINGSTTNNGGALYCGEYGIITLEDCTLRNNEADGSGGAVYGEHATAIHCLFRSNESTGNGGAMTEGAAQFCRFLENQAHASGGGIKNVVADSCIIAENHAQSGGGASGGDVRNCTIINNTASSRGGGVDYVGTAKNCILWYNTAPLGTNLYATTTTYSCSPDLTPGATGCITNEPILIDIPGGNYRLFRTSPCRNAGNNADVFTTEDIEGNERIYLPSSGGIVDMGAYEDVGDRAITFYVDKNNPTPAYPYTNPTIAATNIQTALNLTISGDRVEVSRAHYDIPASISISNRISLVGIKSPTGEKPVIDANDQFQCLDINRAASNSVISSFTITHGSADHHENGGGAAYCPFAIVFSDCDFSYNDAYKKGGALYFYGTANNCQFLFNTAGSGGGTYKGTSIDCLYSGNIAAYQGGGGSLYSTLINCTLTNNLAQGLYPNGGGANNGKATGCLFVDNTANYRGGGMFYGTARNCIFRSNKAGNGGGINATETSNSLLVGNRAQYGGGANHGLLRNCIITENIAEKGGGTYQGTLFNTIVYENTSTNDPIQNVYMPNNLRSVCAEDGVTPGTDGCITNAPAFLDPIIGDYHLRIDSPCIDTGENSKTNSTTDLEGNPRIANATVDMGAYEFIPQAGADTDADDMPDTWEYDHFDGNADATADADSDQLSNLSEYIAGTDPTNSASYLHITQIECEDNGNGVQTTLHWSPSVEGRIYGVSWTTNLVDGFEDTGLFALPYPADQLVIDKSLSGAFYKINVHLDD